MHLVLGKCSVLQTLTLVITSRSTLGTRSTQIHRNVFAKYVQLGFKTQLNRVCEKWKHYASK